MHLKNIISRNIIIRKTILGTLLSAVLIGTVSVSTAPAEAASVKYVTSKTLEIRTKASFSSKSIGHLNKGDKVKVYHIKGSWAKIKRNNKYYYVSKKYLSSKRMTSSASTSTEAGKCIVNYAKKFIGNPYRSGGTSLTKGADCSGFTKAVYAHFGFSLPRTSSAQRHAGRQVSWSQKEPGDLICYSGHVAIYMGNNRIIHASTPKSGIKTSKYITFSKVLSVRRILPS